MKTIRQTLQERFKIFKIDLRIFLINYSKIKPLSYIDDEILFISTDGNRFWSELPNSALSLQSKLFQEFSSILQTTDFIFDKTLPQYKEKYIEFKNYINNSIEQQNATWAKTSQEAYSKCEEYISKVLNVLDILFPHDSEKVILVADTSALLFNPLIEEWSFKDFEKFIIVIPYTVIKELDSFELSNKNAETKKKASVLVNKFKEYARRGDITKGVNIVSNKIILKALPQESSTNIENNSLNNDDRIFASFIDMIRLNFGSYVILVSRDSGLHIKANHFSLPVIDPPGLT